MTWLSYISHIQTFLRCERICLRQNNCTFSINTCTVLTKWYVKPYSCYRTLTLRDDHINSYILRKKIFDNFLKLFCYSSNLSFWFPGYYQFKMSQVSMTLFPGFQSISFLQHFQIMVTLQLNFRYEVSGS